MASVIKIPFILVITLAFHISHTSPNPRTPASKLKAAGGGATDRSVWEVYLRFLAIRMRYVRAMYWAVATAEIATITADRFPISALSTRALAALLERESGHELRLDRLSVLGMVLAVCGTLLRLWCYRALQGLFTFEISIHTDHKLVTTGPYSVVRHPSYTGVILVFLGLACWWGSRGSWIRQSGVLDTLGGRALVGTFSATLLGLLISLLMRMKEEDEALGQVFGQEWEQWARKVPYSIVPGIY